MIDKDISQEMQTAFGMDTTTHRHLAIMIFAQCAKDMIMLCGYLSERWLKIVPDSVITVDNIAPDQCVARGGARPNELWFSDWFIKQGFFYSPAVTWLREGMKITKTYRPEYKRPSGKPNLPPRIWILTGYRHYADQSMLGVWPD